MRLLLLVVVLVAVAVVQVPKPLVVVLVAVVTTLTKHMVLLVDLVQTWVETQVEVEIHRQVVVLQVVTELRSEEVQDLQLI